ncbi:MAG: hypothetical protein JXQ23_09700, partial [Clostridia bacterium]|nr:hypothetical protein [Clostridia bacterium]
VSKEVKKISGMWENKDVGIVEFKQNKTFTFTLPFEIKTGNYTINDKEIVIKGNYKGEEDYRYYYRLEGDTLVLSMREDMKALFGSENLVFKKIKQ